LFELSIALETGTTGLWYGRIIELIGTHARATKRDDVLKYLESEYTYHNEWLSRHGEKPLSDTKPKLVVDEEVNGINLLGESGGEVALFMYDIKPVPRETLKNYLRFMSYNRTDLLANIKSLSTNTLVYVPPNKEKKYNSDTQPHL
jgi:hypothetical protein